MYSRRRLANSLRFRLGSASAHTVYNEECTGLLLGAHLLKSVRTGTYKTVFFAADNKASVGSSGTTYSHSGHHIIDAFLHTIDDIFARTPENLKPTITIRWVPGHEGVEGNEKADVEAKRAVTDGSSPYYDLPTYLRKPLPANLSAIRATHKSQMRQLTDMCWRISPRFRRINQHISTKHLNRFCQLLHSLPRKLASLLAHIVTGHIPLAHYLHRIGKTPSALCPRCSTKPETVDHYLLRCPAYNDPRRILARQCNSSASLHNLTLNRILSQPKHIAALFTYINTTGRLHRTLGTLPPWDPPDD